MGPRSGRKLKALVDNDELLCAVVRQLTNPSELGVGMCSVARGGLAGRQVVRLRYGEPPAGFSRSLI